MDNCYFLKKFFGTILTEDSEEQCFCKNEDMYCLLIYLSFSFQISVCGWLLTMISWGLVMVTLPFSLFVCFKVGHFYTTILFLLLIPKKIFSYLWSFFFDFTSSSSSSSTSSSSTSSSSSYFQHSPVLTPWKRHQCNLLLENWSVPVLSESQSWPTSP